MPCWISGRRVSERTTPLAWPQRAVLAAYQKCAAAFRGSWSTARRAGLPATVVRLELLLHARRPSLAPHEGDPRQRDEHVDARLLLAGASQVVVESVQCARVVVVVGGDRLDSGDERGFGRRDARNEHDGDGKTPHDAIRSLPMDSPTRRSTASMSRVAAGTPATARTARARRSSKRTSW